MTFRAQDRAAAHQRAGMTGRIFALVALVVQSQNIGFHFAG